MHHSSHLTNDAASEHGATGLGRCLLDGDSATNTSARRRRQETFGLSLAIEILLLGLLVLVPLLRSVEKPVLKYLTPPKLILLGNWRVPNQALNEIGSTRSVAAALRVPRLPDSTPRPIFVSHFSEASGELPELTALPSGPEGIANEGTGGIGTAMWTAAPPPPAERPPQPEKRPLKISEGVVAAQLISRIEPVYPALAIQTKTQGVVRLHAIIGRDGRITSLDVLSGHPLLVRAALEAVRQWRYRPTLLNGDAVEVDTEITVIFRLQN